MDGRLQGTPLLLLNALACLADAPEETPPATPDRIHVADGAIRDADGRAVALWAVNDSNTSKKPDTGFLGWTGPEDFAFLAEAGFEAVRMLVFWEAIEPEEGGIDEAYLDEVVRRVDEAAEAGLLVVLDMHQDLYGRGFGEDGAPAWTCDAERYEGWEVPDPWWTGYFTDEVQGCFDDLWASEELLDHLAGAWAALAARVADRPAAIGFDLFNEPFPGSMDHATFSAEVLPAAYERFWTRIDAEAPGRLVFVEPTTLAQYGLGLPGWGPLGRDDLVYAPHFYHPTLHEGLGYDGDPAPIEEALAPFRETADAMGAALWIGETGGQVDAEGYAAYVEDFLALAQQARASAAWWSYDLGGDFSLLDEEGQVREPAEALFWRPHVRAWGGDPLEESWDGDTLRFVVAERAGAWNATDVWIGGGRTATVTSSTDASFEVEADPDAGVVRILPGAAAAEHAYEVQVEGAGPSAG